jgi:hypothetical protein
MTDISLIYTAAVDDKGLHFHNRKLFDKEVQVFNGKEVVITIRRKRNHRSEQQNRYYWGGVVPIVCDGLNDVGYRITKADTHEFLKATFLKDKIVNEQTGEFLETIGSTTRLTTVQFMEFIADIQRWAAEFLGVYIPDPCEQTELTFK